MGGDRSVNSRKSTIKKKKNVCVKMFPLEVKRGLIDLPMTIIAYHSYP